MAPRSTLSPATGQPPNVQVPSRASSTWPDIDMLAAFCGAALLIVALLVTYGLDLSVGLF
jgi:hypothetical protein